MPSAADLRVAPPGTEAGPLDVEGMGRLCDRLRSAHATTRAIPVREMADALGRAAAGWACPSVEHVAALSATTGYSQATVRRALADLARTFAAPALYALLRRELRNPEVLDRTVPGPEGGSERAYGPELTVAVLSGNVFHVAAEALIIPLLTGSPVLLKAPAREPLFPVLFARSVVAADPRLAPAIGVAAWPGGSEEIERAVFGRAEAVIAHGGAEAMAAIRARLPAGVRFVEHGPRVSFALVAGELADDAETARAAARDVAAYDQQGCMSPHAVYVLGSNDHAARFAAQFAQAMAEEESRTPRGQVSPAEAAAIGQARGAAEFRPGAEVYTDAGGTAWTVILDPDPLLTPSPLSRVVHVRPLAALADLPGALAPVRPYLQTVGVAGNARFRLAVAEIVGPLGASRVCALGTMQLPPAWWRHDGRPRLLDLLRWVEVE